MRALGVLEEVSLFSDLTMDELALIAPLAVMKEGKAGDFIIQEGECVENVYVLLSGQATVLRVRPDGKKVSIDQVGKDDLLGEVTFFKNTPASASVQATAPFRSVCRPYTDGMASFQYQDGGGFPRLASNSRTAGMPA